MIKRGKYYICPFFYKVIVQGDYMEKHFILFVALIFVVCGCIYWFRPIKEVQAEVQPQLQEVGKSDFGTVYIDTNTIDTVKKNNVYYLIVSVEERYTDETFLQQLRQSEETKDAVSALDLYMFTNDGRYYCIPQRFWWIRTARCAPIWVVICR